MIIKSSFKELIEQCWEHEPKKRPEFKDIFFQLANYSKDKDFYLDDVDIDKFKQYVNKIQEKNDPIEAWSASIDSYQQESQELKNEKIQLEETNDHLSTENERMKAEIKEMEKEISVLQEEIKKLNIKSANYVFEEQSITFDRNMTIYQFNNLKLNEQESLIPQIISYSTHNSAVLFFMKINNLMFFLSKKSSW